MFNDSVCKLTDHIQTRWAGPENWRGEKDDGRKRRPFFFSLPGLAPVDVAVVARHGCCSH
jgi:hypothetical protein